MNAFRSLIDGGSHIGTILLVVAGVTVLFISLYVIKESLEDVLDLFFSGFEYLDNTKIFLSYMRFDEQDWKKDDEPARLGFCFGPGYYRLLDFIIDVFGGMYSLLADTGIVVFDVVVFVISYVIGVVFSAIVGLIYAAVITVIMIIKYIVFSIIRISDRLYVIHNKIHYYCPVCKEQWAVPMFECPKCGKFHKKLVPGPYGIWKHKCTCGNKIPSTFKGGRSKLNAYCSSCGIPLIMSDAKPVSFQLIGGTRTGKTVFLSAYFHEYLEMLRHNTELSVEIEGRYKPFFEELEKLYKGSIKSTPTKELNSLMYPLLISSSLGVRRLFSIYDVSGEMFSWSNAENEILQKQFHFCNGFLFLIDPFSSGELRKARENAGRDMSDFSDTPSEETAENFINYLTVTGRKKPNERCNTPLAVLITKADTFEVKKEIGRAKLKRIYDNNKAVYARYEEVRDAECRQFLVDIGLHSTVDQLETAFSNLHYFPVSAIGHSPDGNRYKPWGVTDPTGWILSLVDKEVADMINSLHTTDNSDY